MVWPLSGKGAWDPGRTPKPRAALDWVLAEAAVCSPACVHTCYQPTCLCPRKPRPTSDVTVDPGPTPAHPETWRRTRTALLLVPAAPALRPPVDSRSMRPARAQLSLAQSPRLRCAPAGVAGSRPADFSPDRGL